MAVWMERTETSTLEQNIVPVPQTPLLAIEVKREEEKKVSTDALYSSIYTGTSKLILVKAVTKTLMKVDDEAFEKLEKDPKMWKHIIITYDKVTDFLQEKGIEFFANLTAPKYPESGFTDIYVIRFTIKNKTYKEILDLWDEISKAVHEALPPEVSRKIYIVLDTE